MCISGSNARYTMFRGSVKSTGYTLHSPVSPSLPLPCVTVCHHTSTGLYKRLCTTFVTYHAFWMTVCCRGCISSNPTRTTDSQLKRIISTTCCIHTVVPPDGGPRYARNMYRLTKYANQESRQSSKVPTVVYIRLYLLAMGPNTPETRRF